MPLTPLTVDAFGPLDLGRDTFDVGLSGARDLSNVRFDVPGKIIARGGFDTLDSTTQSSVVGFYRYRGNSTTGQQNACYAIRTGSIRWFAPGLASHTDTTVASSTFSGGAVETYPSGSVVLARSNSTLVRGAISSWAPVASTPAAKFLTLSGVENRVVAAYALIGGAPSTLLGGPERVYFSAPSDPDTWDSTDFVDLWPGDGQVIRAAVTFRDQVFVFKDKRFAIFYGEGTDADGGSVFNYRPVDVGIGCAYDFGAAVGPDGVYFIAADGIYRTVGDAPALISGPLQPVFDAATDGDWTGPTAIVTPRLFAAQDRLYFVNDSDVFSYHYATGAWTLDTYTPGVQFLSQTPTEKPRSVYFIDGTGKACEAGDTFADDDGTAIAWSYKSGRYAIADGRVAITTESSLVGSGTVTLTLNTDLYTGQAGTATLGTAPATAEGWPSSVDQEGTWLQHTLSGTGAATVSRLTHHVSSVKPAGVR